MEGESWAKEKSKKQREGVWLMKKAKKEGGLGLMKRGKKGRDGVMKT